MKGDRTAAAGLFASLWAVGLLLSHYGVVATDEVVYFHTARSIATRGAFDVPPFEMLEIRPGRDGRAYGIYPPGYALALAPAVLAGRTLAVLAGRDPDSFGGRTAEIRACYAWAAALAALAGTAPFLALRALGAPPGAALRAVLLLAFGTPALWYIRPLMSDALRTGLAVSAIVPIARLASGAGPRAAATAGGLLAASALLRIDSIFLWPAGLLGVILAARGRPATAVSAFAAPLLAAAALLAAWNLHRFGNPFETGYGHSIPGSAPVWEGLYAKVLSPGQGLAVFGPVALVGLAGWGALARLTGRAPAAYAAAAAALVALGTSATPAWRIGWEWGPRYLHTPWTLAGLGLAFLPSPGWRRAAIVLAAWGLGVNLLGASSDFTRHYAAVGDVERVVLDPAASPIAAQARAVAAGRLDLPVLRTWLLALGLLLAAAAGLRAAGWSTGRDPLGGR